MSSAPVFVADPLPPPGSARLDGPEGHHAARVRRLRAGEQLILTDGRGGYCDATVAVAERDALQLDTGETQLAPAPLLRLVAVQAVAKGDRAELAVELLTELGVDEIVPWAAQRCIARWGDAAGDKARKACHRWSAAATEAAKQSRRVWFPTVAPLASTADVAARLADAAAALVLHETARQPLVDLSFPSAGEIVVVIGPEGGIAAQELSEFTDAGATAVRLGNGVLRTSTAGAAALAAISAHTRWRGPAA